MENEGQTKYFKVPSIWQQRSWTNWMVSWLILSAIVLTISIHFNWLYWGNNALVADDVHREFITPLRLSQGEVLYKDFNFPYSPFPPYLNSWIIEIPFFNVFTILRFVAFGLFLLSVLFLWLVCRDIKLYWIFGPVLFGIVAWTTSYTYNPSSFNGIYATLFATFGTWCAVRTLKGKSWPWFCLGIACAGALLSKPEGVFVVGLASIGAYVHSTRLHKRLLNLEGLRWLIGFISLAGPFVIFLFHKGLSWMDLIEGILQRRFQENLSMGFIQQYNYFFGINHIIVITAGCVFIAVIFYLMKLYQMGKRFMFGLFFSIAVLFLFISAFSGQLTRLTNDYQNLGDFFGGILGYWWYRQLPDGILKKGFFILWLSSLGGWLRPLFHIGAIVIPFRVGGGMLLALIFWFLMLPTLFQRIYSGSESNSKWIANIFLLIGSVGVIIFGITGLSNSWDTQWKHPTIKFETQYGSFLANRDAESTQSGSEVICWLQENLNRKQRIIALEGLPIELIMGWLPCIPLSQLNYQIYDGDTQKITSILDKRNDIKYVLVQIRHGGYHFGIQDYELADYLDNNWQQVKRFRVPDQLTRLSQMSGKRKLDAGLIEGFILYGRKE